MKKLICCLVVSTVAVLQLNPPGSGQAASTSPIPMARQSPTPAYMDFKEHNGEVSGTGGPILRSSGQS